VVGAEDLNVGRHAVQFYGRDEELAERVTGYLLGALASGGVAIVIATPEHRREFEIRLGQAGVDLTAAGDDGSYLARDAAQTLSELMAADQLDSAAFDRVIGTVIAAAGAAGRPVRAFGEMVALLWYDGLASAAVQLEMMWEELASRHPFSLFCGYRADSGTSDMAAFAEVCRLHEEIVGGRSATARTFAFSREAPAAARHFAVATLNAWGAGDMAGDLAGDVALVVTELAANAIEHAGSAFTVILSPRDDLLRISVRDAGALDGTGLRATPLHGLAVVDAMASRWGVESLGNAGKTVWVDLLR
jgi:MEDS: MEthanogen/methylotroph, DcmR Sensory domain